jgi:hypothetical protein
MKKEDLKIVDGEDNIVSINQREKLKDLKKKYPNLQIILGELTKDDKPVPVDLGRMDLDRKKILDAATENILGKRIDKMERPMTHPTGLYLLIIGFLAGVTACYIFYNAFGGHIGF